MMTIGFLGDGGKERQLLLLLNTLKKHEDIFTCLVVMNPGGERKNEFVQVANELVVLDDRKTLDFIKPILKLTHLIKYHQIDIIHTWGSGIWDLIGLIAGRMCHIPVLHYGIQSAPNRLNIYNQLTRVSALFADVSVANSEAGLKSFKMTNRPKSEVIYNGLETSRFEGIELNDNGRNLCMVANFQQRKDHKSLVLAMPEILNYFPETRLILVGHDYGTLDEINDLVNELEISQNVTIITDCIHPEPIIGDSQIGILATNDAFHGEGISNSILEYMALSRPVIASRNGGCPEVVIENVTGFLVQPGSPKAISEKVIYLLENPTIAQKMGSNGKIFVNERFSLEKLENDFINLYQKLSV